MTPIFVLIHSPVTGPFTWQPVAKVLEIKGYKTLVPALNNRKTPYWPHYANLVAGSVDSIPENTPLVLVAHSAAGLLIPAVKAAIPDKRIVGFIFVDASLPSNGTSLVEQIPAEVGIGIEQLRAQAKEGHLPPWGSSWGEETWNQLVPDDSLRKHFRLQLQPIPLALYEEHVPGTPEWDEIPCAYLRFSQLYADTEQEAQQLGWETRQISGQHLHMLVEPVKVSEELIKFLKAMMQK